MAATRSPLLNTGLDVGTIVALITAAGVLGSLAAGGMIHKCALTH